MDNFENLQPDVLTQSSSDELIKLASEEDGIPNAISCNLPHAPPIVNYKETSET